MTATIERMARTASTTATAVIATLLGYGIWNTLLSRYPSSSVAPFSMLVPIVGVLSSWALFGERIDGVEAAAGVAVVGGVLIGSLPLRRRVRRVRGVVVVDEDGVLVHGVVSLSLAGGHGRGP